MTNYEAPEIDVQQLMAGIRESLSKRNLAERRLRSSLPVTRKTESEIPELNLTPPFQTRSDNHYHVNDLLRFHDREFVRNAYRAILKREPDEFGYRNYLDALRDGSRNKIDVLARLRYSSEGVQKNVRLDGLRFTAQMRKLGRVPVIGYVVQLLTGLLRLPASAQDRRRFESHALIQQREIADHINHIAAILRNLESFAGELPSRIDEQSLNFSVLLNQQRDLLQTLSAAHGEQFTLHGEQLALTQKRIAQQEAELANQVAGQSHLAETFSQQVSQEAADRTALAARLNEELVKGQIDLQKQAADAKRFALSVQQVRAELSVQQTRISTLLSSVSETSPALNQVSAFSEEEAHLNDSLYVSLEDRFRGERDDIKQRLTVYLPYFEQAGVSSNILDIGCGRGEWLELLKDKGLEARGVDSNRTMIERCQAASLEVVGANAVEHLRSLEDQSISAITSFHVIEHLEFKTLLEMIDEIIRVLKPGGLVILETPNPENVLVGSCNFYLDPSHRNPLPRQVMQFLFETRGLIDVEVLPLHPLSEGRIAGDTELTNRFNDLFFGPMDYAIIGHRP